MQLRQLDVPVDGGELRVLLWGTGRRVAVAVHGITASAMSWQAVARQMPPGWTLAAPDLRGRGRSNHLPGPYGLEQHAADVTAVLRHFGGRPVLAGHSMGTFVTLLAYDAHPNLVRRLVLVDGGLPLIFPDGVDPEAAIETSLAPALARLRQTFPDTEAYLDFWRAHPALADHWTAVLGAYCRYDLTGEPGRLRSRVLEDAVRADNRDQVAGKPFAEALGRLTKPTPLLTAPAGFYGVPPGLYTPEYVAGWQERVPQLRPQLVPDTNHYTILFSMHGAAAVARAITSTPA
ncbi:MAG: alpha/beta hydrolase [Mycobacteriaceae bacterium]|nr:alpha/beta hydrolase [Mycobacteriaceae bacterium]